MTYQTYFRCILVLPLLTVLLVLGPSWSMPLWQDEFGTINGLPLYLAALPYAVFAAGMAWGTWGKTDKTFMRAVWLSPLILLPFAIVGWAILSHPRASAWHQNYGWSDFMFAATAVLLGYLYVLSAEALRRLFGLARRLTRTPS